MQHQSSSNLGSRTRAIAGTIAGAVAVICAPLPVWGSPPASPAHVYTVIDLGPAAATALLNERGQAAFGSFTAYGYSNGFFDGDRLHDIGSLGGSHTWLRGLNKAGMVVGARAAVAVASVRYQ